MSDFARLEDKLSKLRQRERIAGEGRKLGGASAEARLAAIVTEIDETILPRRLTFEVENGPRIHLAVANRKLQALMAPVPENSRVDATAFADAPLSDVDAPEVTKLRDLLLAVLEVDAPVSIQSERPAKGGFASDVGIPANILSRNWRVSDGQPEVLSPEEIVTRFLSGLKEDRVTWLRIEGENVTDQGGVPEAVEALGEQAAIFLDGYFGKYETLFPEGEQVCASVIASDDKGASAVLFVEFGELSAFVAASTDTILDLAMRWQRLTAP